MYIYIYNIIFTELPFYNLLIFLILASKPIKKNKKCCTTLFFILLNNVFQIEIRRTN